MPYAITHSPSDSASGMGANPLKAGGGFSFRIWAPDASQVQVLLRSDSASPYQRLNLQPDPNPAYWSADVSGVAVGDQYRFNMTNDPTKGPNNPGGDFERVDPRPQRSQSRDRFAGVCNRSNF